MRRIEQPGSLDLQSKFWTEISLGTHRDMALALFVGI